MSLFAGVCETNITPPPGVWMGGYAFRSTGCVGIHDELYARALVVDNGRRRVALVTADLVALDFDLVTRVREGIAGLLDITPSAVMLHCTHTHGGPLTKSYRGMGTRDDAYVDVLARKLIGVVRQAADTLQPVHLTYGDTSAQIGVNRRRSGPDGQAGHGPDYAAPVAPLVQTVCVQRADGRTLALLFSHACHPTTLGGDNLQISAEWPGAAVEHLKGLMRRDGDESGWAPGALPLFMQGCCGDINPYRRGTWAAIAEQGAQVGGAAHTARWNAHARYDDAQALAAQEITLMLPLLPTPTTEECDRLIAEAAAQLERERANGGHVGRILQAEGMLQWAQDARALAETPNNANEQPFAIQHLTLAGIHLLGFPAEMFVGYQLDFAAQCRAPVLSLSFTNGCWGYLPTFAEYARGGYEVDTAYKYYGTRMFAPESEKIVRAAVYQLLEIEKSDTATYAL
jgi:hypothetical protein